MLVSISFYFTLDSLHYREVAPGLSGATFAIITYGSITEEIEHKEMGKHQAMNGGGWPIFSQETVRDFWKQLPLTVLLAVLLLAVTILWVFSCIVCTFTHHPKRFYLPL